MMKNEIKILKELQKTLRETDKLISSLLEIQIAEQTEIQTNQDCEQLIQSSHKLAQLTNSELRNADIENIISKVIRELGVPPHIKGYKYLITSIKLVIEDKDNLESVTKVLYPNVAKQHKSTYSKVERAIRHAIHVSYNSYRDLDLFYDIFGNSISREKRETTNSQFIAGISDYLLRNYNFV